MQIILCLTLFIGMILIQQWVHQACCELLNCIGHQLSQCFNLWVGEKNQIYMTNTHHTTHWYFQSIKNSINTHTQNKNVEQIGICGFKKVE